MESALITHYVLIQHHQTQRFPSLLARTQSGDQLLLHVNQQQLEITKLKSSMKGQKNPHSDHVIKFRKD